MLEKRRFPRTDDVDLLYMIEVRAKYQPPMHDRRKGHNPADAVIDFNLRCSKKQIRQLCRKHALEDTGSKRKMMKRLYLHWRAVAMQKGKVYYGYGKGYENTRKPDCCPRCFNRIEMKKLAKKEEAMKEMRQRQRRDAFKELPQRRIYRYPRLPEGMVMRYPR